jgi:hypothetical protein
MALFPQGLVSFPGIVSAKGAIYTQTLGVYPDRIAIRAVPQLTPIATYGTITFSFTSATLTLPGCYFDEARVVASASDGFYLSLIFLDRRERWRFAAPVSGYYNTYRVGTQTPTKKKSLRELVLLLLQHVGEASPDVSLLSNAIYPEVRWECESAVAVLDKLLREWGFSIALGFGTEVVKVVQLGIGTLPGLTTAMMASSTVDPKVRPQYIRTCFGPSIAQARFKLEPIALETDEMWVGANTVSYKPAGGWENEFPARLPTVLADEPTSTFNRAIKSVFRAYRIVAFADNTLNYPDGSGALTSIEQCLPLFNRLLDDEAIRTDGSAIPFRIYGKRFVPAESNGQPAKDITTTVDDEIVGEKVLFDGENGIILFENPQYFTEVNEEEGGSGVEEYKFADLYLECSFGILNATGNYPTHYEKDILLDSSGLGYHSVKYPELEARTVVAYTTGQAVSGMTTNQTALDAIAALIAESVSVQYATDASQMIVYAMPEFTLRCNGIVHQVQHVISDGTEHAASYSTVSSNMEFDRCIASRDERAAMAHDRLAMLAARSESVLARRREKADD